MAKRPTPLQYAKSQIAAGKFANLPIYEVCGQFYLCDGDWNLLEGRAYPSRDAAIAGRSKVLAQAAKSIA